MKKTSDKITFRITYETHPDGCEYRYRGFLPRSGNIPERRSNQPKRPSEFTLRQAYEIYQATYAGKGPVEADSFPCDVPRWLTWDIELGDMFSGTTDGQMSLHLGDVSPLVARLIAQLFGVKVTPATQTRK